MPWLTRFAVLNCNNCFLSRPPLFTFQNINRVVVLLLGEQICFAPESFSYQLNTGLLDWWSRKDEPCPDGGWLWCMSWRWGWAPANQVNGGRPTAALVNQTLKRGNSHLRSPRGAKTRPMDGRRWIIWGRRRRLWVREGWLGGWWTGG